MSRKPMDPFHWDDNDEDQVRAVCACGWAAEWRDYFSQVRIDEREHACTRATAWREQVRS